MIPAIHALTGCDTTSKVSTKKVAFACAQSDSVDFIQTFAKQPLSENMINDAESFLVKCLSPKSISVSTFDELRYIKYHSQSFNLDFEKLPTTSTSIRKHIKRAYFQGFRWLRCPYDERFELDPKSYGYEFSNDLMKPDLLITPKIPDDFPQPCNCRKCSKSTVCPCRVNEIKCCGFCKCFADKMCKNPIK